MHFCTYIRETENQGNSAPRTKGSTEHPFHQNPEEQEPLAACSSLHSSCKLATKAHSNSNCTTGLKKHITVLLRKAENPQITTNYSDKNKSKLIWQ